MIVVVDNDICNIYILALKKIAGPASSFIKLYIVYINVFAVSEFYKVDSAAVFFFM